LSPFKVAGKGGFVITFPCQIAGRKRLCLIILIVMRGSIDPLLFIIPLAVLVMVPGKFFLLPIVIVVIIRVIFQVFSCIPLAVSVGVIGMPMTPTETASGIQEKTWNMTRIMTTITIGKRKNLPGTITRTASGMIKSSGSIDPLITISMMRQSRLRPAI